MQEMFNNPNRQLSMPTMKGQLQRKMWSDKESQGDHSTYSNEASNEMQIRRMF